MLPGDHVVIKTKNNEIISGLYKSWCSGYDADYLTIQTDPNDLRLTFIKLDDVDAVVDSTFLGPL